MIVDLSHSFSRCIFWSMSYSPYSKSDHYQGCGLLRRRRRDGVSCRGIQFIATATPGDNCSGSVIFQLPLSAKFGSVGGCLALHKLFKYPRHLYFFRNNEALHVYMNKVSHAFALSLPCFTQSTLTRATSSSTST